MQVLLINSLQKQYYYGYFYPFQAILLHSYLSQDSTLSYAD